MQLIVFAYYQSPLSDIFCSLAGKPETTHRTLFLHPSHLEGSPMAYNRLLLRLWLRQLTSCVRNITSLSKAEKFHVYAGNNYSARLVNPILPIRASNLDMHFLKFNALLLDFPADIRLRLSTKCQGNHLFWRPIFLSQYSVFKKIL